MSQYACTVRRAVLAAFIAAHSPHVVADEPTNDDRLEEIVVTAQQRPQTLQEVPISALVVDAQTLTKNGIVGLQDLAPRLPNVNITPSVSTDILSIRGMGSGFNSAFEQSVGTFVDGVYRGRARSMRISLFDIDRVEVLRGPQITFFGNNAIGGAFNIATKRPKPGHDLEYNVTTSYAQPDGEYNAEGGVSFPLAPEMAGRVVVRAYGTDGWVENDFTGEDEPHERNKIARAAFAWEPSSAYRMDFRIDGGAIRTTGSSASELIDCPPDPSFGIAARGACAAYLAAAGSNADVSFDYEGDKPGGYFDNDYYELALTNRLDIGHGAITAITAYYDHDIDYKPILIPVAISSPIGTSDWLDYRLLEQFHQFSQEIRYESPTGGRFEYLGGLYYSSAHLDLDTLTGAYFAPLGARVSGYTPTSRVGAIAVDTRRDKTYSAFAAGTFHATDSLRFSVGLRYSDVEKEGHRGYRGGEFAAGQVADDRFTAGTPAQQGVIAAMLGADLNDFPNTTRSDPDLMYSGGVQWDIREELTTYATYSYGVKAGGWSSGSTANEFDKEKVNAYELGAKGTVLDGRLFYSVAAFLSKYEGLQEASNNALPSGQIISFVGNVAEAESKGIELSLSYRANALFSFNLDGAYLEAEYTDYPNASCNTIQSATSPPGCVQDLSGRTRPYAPKWSGNLSMLATLPVGGNELRFEPSVSYKSELYMLSTLDPLSVEKAHAKLDARLAYGPESHLWEVALIGRNLTDEKIGQFRNTLISSPGSSYVIPERPRSVALQFTLRN